MFLAAQQPYLTDPQIYLPTSAHRRCLTFSRKRASQTIAIMVLSLKTQVATYYSLGTAQAAEPKGSIAIRQAARLPSSMQARVVAEGIRILVATTLALTLGWVVGKRLSVVSASDGLLCKQRPCSSPHATVSNDQAQCPLAPPRPSGHTTVHSLNAQPRSRRRRGTSLFQVRKEELWYRKASGAPARRY